MLTLCIGNCFSYYKNHRARILELHIHFSEVTVQAIILSDIAIQRVKENVWFLLRCH